MMHTCMRMGNMHEMSKWCMCLGGGMLAWTVKSIVNCQVHSVCASLTGRRLKGATRQKCQQGAPCAS